MSEPIPIESDDALDAAETLPVTGPVSVTAGADHAGQRLDRFLAQNCHGLSRSRIGALMREGRVSGPRGTLVEADYRVKPGDAFVVDVPEPAPSKPAGENVALSIVHEDRHLIVIDKPAGMVVHPAAGHANGTLVNALIAHCGASLSGIGGVRRPGIVHRLDKDTSGLLVVAKSDAAHQGLSEQFASHGVDGRLERAYLALVWGAPLRPKGTIEGAIGRSPINRQKMAVVPEQLGRRAVTHYEVERAFIGNDGKAVCALLKVHLETGRTHQIRVHAAHIGHPVVADPVYGTGFRTSAVRLAPQARDALARLGRQALHAVELGFEHPVTGKRLRFKSELPQDVARLVAALERPTEMRR